MKIGLEVYDEDGNIILELDDNLAKITHVVRRGETFVSPRKIAGQEQFMLSNVLIEMDNHTSTIYFSEQQYVKNPWAYADIVIFGVYHVTNN